MIRKPGYTSRFFRTDQPLPARITLTGAKPRPVCELVRIPGTKSFAAGDPYYYSTFTETIETADGPRRIVNVHARLGSSHYAPADELVWSSAEYSEVYYSSGELDAQGHSAAGRYWRYFGTMIDNAAYQDVDQATAALFNRKMDGDCSAKPQP